MNTKNIESEKKIDKVTLSDMELPPLKPIDTEKREFHPVENYHPENENRSVSHTMHIFSISILILIILLCIAFVIFTFVNNQNTNIISGISIKGVDVSGLSIEEAKENLQNYINENLPENINLVHNDYETSIPLSALNVSFDIDSSVNQAYEIGKSGNIFENGFTALKTLISPVDIDLTLTLDEEQLKTALNDISSKLPDTVIESGYYIDGTDLIVTRGSEGNVVNVDQMYSYIKNGISNLTLKNRTLDIATVSKQPSEINMKRFMKKYINNLLMLIIHKTLMQFIHLKMVWTLLYL